MRREPVPGPLARPLGDDSRPLTSHLLDVLARTTRPVALAELHEAFAHRGHSDVDHAIGVLVRRGRIRRTGAAVRWIRPRPTDSRPVTPIL